MHTGARQSDIRKDLVGSVLLRVSALLFAPEDQEGIALRIGFALHLSTGTLVIAADSELDTIQLSFGIDEPRQIVEFTHEEDWSVREPFARFVGSTIHNCWYLRNDADLKHGLLIAFAPTAGLSFIVMAGEPKVQVVEGEQFS